MRKKLVRIGALMLLMIPAMTTYAGKETLVSYNVETAYTILIPADTTVAFNELEASYGKIVVENAQVDEEKCIQVTMNADGVLKNQTDSDSVIPYQILAEGKPFTTEHYTKTGEETELTISIQQDDWNRATAGAYKTAVTFTISYVDKEE